MAKDKFTIEEVVEMVEREETRTQSTRDRQDRDLNRWRQEEYNTNTDGSSVDAGADFASFTGNEARAYAKKVVALLSSAKVIIQVPYGDAPEAMTKLFDVKERFAYGLIDAANDALADEWLEPEIHSQFSWFSPHRGFICIRHIFVNSDDDTTEVSIRPVDARNAYWRTSKGGLLWACLKLTRSLADLREEYPKAELDGDDEDEVVVYDIDTRKNHAVMTDTVMLKEWTEHGDDMGVPWTVTAVPFSPPLWSDVITDINAEYGESIFAENRGLFDAIDEVMSITLELLSRAREPSSIVFTDEEDAELEDDPNEKGGVHILGREDKFQQLAPPETTNDAQAFLAYITGMLQRGGLPYSSYGELQFAISGYAITQLNQQILTVLAPQVKAMERAYKSMITRMVDQFVSGRFNPITIRGLGNNRDYTQMTFTPELLANLPPFTVKVVAELPQDDVARLTAAQTARGGDTPFLPDRWLYDELLHVPDAGLIERMVKVQMAERASPRALSHTLADAAQSQGRTELSQIHKQELDIANLQMAFQALTLQVQMAMAGQAGAGGAGGLGGEGGGGLGASAGAGEGEGGGLPGISSGISPGIAASGQPNGPPLVPRGSGRPLGAPRNSQSESAGRVRQSPLGV